MKFKVGDVVKTMSDDGGRLFPVGTVGVVIDIEPGSDCQYKVLANHDYWWYSDDMLMIHQEQTYEQGLIDMWNALSYIYFATHSERRKIFGNDNFSDILLLTPEEIISKYRVYTDRATVNDVVKLQDDILALVIDESSDDTVFVLTENRCMEEWPRCELKRTGKRIDVNAIITQMKEV